MRIEAASLALTGLRHAFFTRAGGVSGGNAACKIQDAIGPHGEHARGLHDLALESHESF